MKPITRKEYYLAKAAGTYTGPTPPPVLREDYYLATLSGDYSGYCPAPVTRLDMFMSASAGLTSYVPYPVTRVEKYWYAIAKGTGYVPQPVTREEKFLYAILKKPPKPEYLDKTAKGSTILLTDSAQAPLTALTVYGKSTQDGTPSPENPVPIVSAGDEGEINVEVLGGNLISSDISNWDSNGWNVFEQVVTQLPKGIKLKAINGWSKVYYDTSEMNGKMLNFSFDYQQIESETTSSGVDNAFAIIAQNENLYPDDNIDDRIFTSSSPQTVKTHVSVSFTARNYLCFLLRVSSEGEALTRTIEITNIMLNTGDAELQFEPYKTPKTLTLSTPPPNGLPGIPVTSGGNYTDENGQQWVCDEIDLARGKYVQRVAIEQKTGNFQMSETADVPGRYHQYGALDTVYKNGRYKSFCNIATWIRWGIEKTETEWKFAISDNGFYLNPPVESGITTADELNAILNSLDFPLVFVGQLETPNETDLPAEEIAAYKALHTYILTTTLSNDAEARMKVGYKATS